MSVTWEHAFGPVVPTLRTPRSVGQPLLCKGGPAPSPEKLRIRARHLQGQAESLFNEAEELLALAREIEAAQEKAGK